MKIKGGIGRLEDGESFHDAAWEYMKSGGRSGVVVFQGEEMVGMMCVIGGYLVVGVGEYVLDRVSWKQVPIKRLINMLE